MTATLRSQRRQADCSRYRR